MLVTMFTDASLIHETQSGAWAMWAKSERGTIRHSGPLGGMVLSSGEAELKALANGLAVLVQSAVFQPGDEVLAQLDNMQAIALVRGQPGSASPPMREVARYCGRLSLQHDFVLTLRHIKAHVGTDAPRNWVHDQCDQRARALARQLHRYRVGETELAPARG